MDFPDTFQNEYNNNLYKKTLAEFPFETDELNTSVGEELRLHVNRPDLTKKGNKDEDSNLNYNRPEIDKEYELELGNDLKFATTSFKISLEDDGKNYGILRYKINLVKESDKEKVEKTEREFNEFRNDLDVYKNNEARNFLCRLYLLNTSNLTTDDSAEEAFVWIKRYDSDTEWKDERTFSVAIGEINQMYPLLIRYPETFFLTLQIHTNQKIVGLFNSSSVIGETTIDLERRYFNPTYKSKLKEFKTFKQIPIESRTLFQNNQAKGAIRMWIELIPRSRDDLVAERLMAFTMSEKYELRLIIWNTRNVPCIDGGKVDIMVKVSFNDGIKDVEQETDVHAASKDGNGQFNWRVVIQFQYPNPKVGNITISVYDYNSISKNELIGSNVINIKKFLARVQRSKSTVEFPRDWLNLSIYYINCY
jgi:hypothetical protein